MYKQKGGGVKAWEYLYKRTKQAFPSLTRKKNQQMGETVERLIKYSDDLIRMLWEATPESGAPSCLIAGAISALENKGLDVSKAEVLFEEGLNCLKTKDYLQLQRITAQILKTFKEAPKVSSHNYFSYNHPTLWEEFEGEIPPEEYLYNVKEDDYTDRVYGSWLGEIIGGAFGGGPFEGYTPQAIQKVFGEVTEYIGKPSTVNDDVTYELAFLEAFKEKGYKVSSADIAEKWLMYIPFGWTAETIALENLRRGIYPPESGSFLNYFSEWIGAQMRAGVIGLVAPGKPKLASHLAFIDGQISHEKNGVYAECFVAAMVSLAFVKKDIRKIIVEALSYVPKTSEFYAVVSEVIGISEKASNCNFVIKKIEERFKRYHWVHAYPNIWIVINALWWSRGSFGEALRISLLGGLDTDCNCGVVGAIMGVLKGVKGINKSWYQPFNDILETYNMRGKFTKMKISALAQETVEAVRKYW